MNNNENENENNNNFEEENVENKPEEDVKIIDKVIDFKQTYQNMASAGKVRRTIPFLTKYEKARVIGKRAMQISKGSPPLVDVGTLENPIDIALKELRERKIPFIIRRPLPNGDYEDFRVDELRIEN